MGIFEKYSVRILGTPIQSIIETEDRKIFADRVNEIGEKVAPSAAVYSIAEVTMVLEIRCWCFSLLKVLISLKLFTLYGQLILIVNNVEKYFKYTIQKWFQTVASFS